MYIEKGYHHSKSRMTNLFYYSGLLLLLLFSGYYMHKSNYLANDLQSANKELAKCISDYAQSDSLKKNLEKELKTVKAEKDSAAGELEALQKKVDEQSKDLLKWEEDQKNLKQCVEKSRERDSSLAEAKQYIKTSCITKDAYDKANSLLQQCRDMLPIVTTPLKTNNTGVITTDVKEWKTSVINKINDVSVENDENKHVDPNAVLKKGQKAESH